MPFEVLEAEEDDYYEEIVVDSDDEGGYTEEEVIDEEDDEIIYDTSTKGAKRKTIDRMDIHAAKAYLISLPGKNTSELEYDSEEEWEEYELPDAVTPIRRSQRLSLFGPPTLDNIEEVSEHSVTSTRNANSMRISIMKELESNHRRTLAVLEEGNEDNNDPLSDPKSSSTRSIIMNDVLTHVDNILTSPMATRKSCPPSLQHVSSFHDSIGNDKDSKEGINEVANSVKSITRERNADNTTQISFSSISSLDSDDRSPARNSFPSPPSKATRARSEGNRRLPLSTRSRGSINMTSPEPRSRRRVRTSRGDSQRRQHRSSKSPPPRSISISSSPASKSPTRTSSPSASKSPTRTSTAHRRQSRSSTSPTRQSRSPVSPAQRQTECGSPSRSPSRQSPTRQRPSKSPRRPQRSSKSPAGKPKRRSRQDNLRTSVKATDERRRSSSLGRISAMKRRLRKTDVFLTQRRSTGSAPLSAPLEHFFAIQGNNPLEGDSEARSTKSEKVRRNSGRRISDSASVASAPFETFKKSSKPKESADRSSASTSKQNRPSRSRRRPGNDNVTSSSSQGDGEERRRARSASVGRRARIRRNRFKEKQENRNANARKSKAPRSRHPSSDIVQKLYQR